MLYVSTIYNWDLPSVEKSTFYQNNPKFERTLQYVFEIIEIRTT